MHHSRHASAGRLVVLVFVAVWAASARAAGIPLVDPAGAPRGSVVLKLSRGLVQLKIAGLAPLPAAVSGAGGSFTAYNYKAYAFSSANPAVEIFLTDVYPNARQRAVRRIRLGGDVSRLGLDRVAVTAFSDNGQQAFDVLTASFAP